MAGAGVRGDEDHAGLRGSKGAERRLWLPGNAPSRYAMTAFGTIFSRYVFRQSAGTVLLILLSLCGVVWIALALRQLNLVTTQGQETWIFIKMTLLALPNLMALVAPLAQTVELGGEISSNRRCLISSRVGIGRPVAFMISSADRPAFIMAFIWRVCSSVSGGCVGSALSGSDGALTAIDRSKAANRSRIDCNTSVSRCAIPSCCVCNTSRNTSTSSGRLRSAVAMSRISW